MDTPIIAPEDLRARLEDRSHELRILDCRSGPNAREAYRAAHVHGAIHADLERDLSAHTDHPEQGGRHPLPSIEAWADTLGRWGIEPSTFVVLYDDKGGANAAARAWWMLRAVRHDAVAVLDGGFDAARAAGVPIDAEAVAIDPKPRYPARAWQLPMRDIEEVDWLKLDETFRLIDVRAPERYRGESEPFDPVAGHIPGAHNIPLTESLRADGTFKSADELRAHFRSKLGDVPMKNVVVSCGSGVTACHTLLALEAAGLRGAYLYVGSWSEWCRSGRPYAKGPRPT